MDLIQYPLHSIHRPKKVDSRRPGLPHLIANLFSGLDKILGVAELEFICSKGNPHGSGYPNGWRTTNRHRSNGFSHRGGTPAIEIADLLRKPPLIKDSYTISPPFNGFKFHSA
jgi:hypothetical protein